MANKRGVADRKDIRQDVEYIQSGLEALHELAMSHGSGISGATLSICLESMSLDLQAKAQRIVAVLDGSSGVAHG